MAKKLLALPLILILALCMATPAAFALEAEPQSTVNWDDFYIVTQPIAQKSLRRSDNYTLSVEVNIPEGVEVEYQWNRREDAAEATLLIGPDGLMQFRDDLNPGQRMLINCIVTGYEKDGDTVISSRELSSNNAEIYLRGTAWENFVDIFVAPLTATGLSMVTGFLPSMFMPLFLPLFVPLFIIAAPFVGIYLFYDTLSTAIQMAKMY